jgi:hypothetical protein
LRGRSVEWATLERLLAGARSGRNQVLVLRGEAGVGKTALLDFVVERASGFRIARAAGVESEMELAFAGLQQLCAPLLNHLEGLPGPQRDALVFAASEGADDELGGLPELAVGGLTAGDARALLDSVILGRLDERVRDRIIAETRGNPLALLELLRGLTAEELAGGFGRPDARPLAGQIEQAFLRRVQSLPVQTQRVLLAAAAEPVGDVSLLMRTAERLGVPADAASPADAAGLIEVGTRVRFRHPLVRSAVYRAADLMQRRGIHRALAEVTDRSRGAARTAAGAADRSAAGRPVDADHRRPCAELSYAAQCADVDPQCG